MNSNNTRIAVGAGVVIILLAIVFGIFLLRNNSTKTASLNKTNVSKVSPTQTPKPQTKQTTNKQNANANSNTYSNSSFTMPATGVGGSCDTCDKYLTGDQALACKQEMGCSY